MPSLSNRLKNVSLRYITIFANGITGHTSRPIDSSVLQEKNYLSVLRTSFLNSVNIIQHGRSLIQTNL